MFTLPIKGSDAVYTVNPSKIICVGRNYLEHVKEGALIHGVGEVIEVPSEPILFPKFPNTLLPPDGDIELPLIIGDYDFEARTDYEGELAIIIGKDCKHVAEEEAYSVIYGFTCLLDISQRNIQNGDRSGWFRGKSFDTFAPLGPVVVPIDQMEDPQSLSLETRLNGRVVQQGNTEQMIFPLKTLIAYISRNFSLKTGDIIATGTPSGVGPLKEGDTIEVEIEKIGCLKNQVVQESL
ncbi:fumarylacetoacetate hydrolase family protein [Oceanispirochaeta sp.]|uniref:fumarylacetoacetate hydrolase family protein n=1 Tax=Oceanispirochaeta sp. TaxID=2035350 RepID=UPI0026345E7A|nr:fumarylacetoacetate hydrolase family protein [Oceanispirochaeta sp.]MDA3956787.1 fumarylacetoacetate hydrolase family protein [Oceanispirochaeta sp.]